MARPEDIDDAGDDDALRWAGDEERGRVVPRLRGPGDASSAPAPLEDPEEFEEAPGARGRRIAAIAYAVPYLAITIGWLFATQQLSSGSQSLFTEIVWQFGEFLAMLSAPLWFAAVLTLTRDARAAARVGWFAVGLGVLLPWPLILQFLAALRLVGSVS